MKIRTIMPSMVASAVLSVLLVGCNEQSKSTTATSQPVDSTSLWAHVNSVIPKDDKVEQKVDAILAKMTIEQKVAQTIQPEIKSISVEDMRRYGFGSYLNGGGSFPNGNKHATPKEWIDLADAMYQASIDASLDGSTIPTMWGTDAVHGHNNVIGATIFPHNIGLGATNNPKLLEQIGAITAKEVRATGIDWVFAPTVATVRDDRWGRTYEGYSEDPEIVKAYAGAMVKGLQGVPENGLFADDKVISTVKHFLGDGGTEGGDDQGNNLASESELYRIHAQGYVSGLAAGAQSVMASFNSWKGEKAHGSHYLLTEVLKNKMGFDGFVVGDWNGHGQVPGCSNESCPNAMNAGLDVFMVPGPEWKPLLENTIAQVKSGAIPESRLNDAVRRILRVKVRAGLFESVTPKMRPLSGDMSLIGAKAHRDVAKQAVRESLVLLKNNNQLLPLNANSRILLAGDGADNIGKQSGGWSITWQGTGNTNEDFPGGTSIFDGFKAQVEKAGGQVELSVSGAYTQKPDVAVVVFGEDPYAEGNGDLANVEYQRGNKRDLQLLEKLKSQGIPVVAIFLTGRPLWVNPELNASDAFVVAWLPGSEGGAIADVLLKDKNDAVAYDFKGKLTFSWPSSPTQTAVNRGDSNYNPLLPYGYGLSYGQQSQQINLDNLPTEFKTVQGELANHEILVRDVKAPSWAQIREASGETRISSSVTRTPSLEVSTEDKTVQEDARNLVFTGKAEASFEVLAAFPSDLRNLLEADARLNFALKVNHTDEAQSFSIAGPCNNECEKTVQVAIEKPTGWYDVSVPVSCFASPENDLSKVMHLFKLTADKPLNISIADVYVGASNENAVTISCNN